MSTVNTPTPKSNAELSSSFGSDLTEADYRRLAARWITRELADAAGLRRVDSYTGREMFGRKSGDLSGIIIPYVSPGENRVEEYRLRLDNPELERRSDDTVRETAKYIQPPCRRNRVYFPPGLQAAALADISIQVIITEGEFKTLALWRLANHDSTVPRFLPIGLGGVWNWRGTVGKTIGPNGDRRDVKGVIPDLDLVTWEGRRAIIAFDADAKKNEHVEIARTFLARELRTRGAEVATVTWDVAQGKGIDDLLANAGPEKVLELLEGVEFEEEDADDNISVHLIAEAIAGRYRFARDAGGRLYVYRSGCYHPDGAPFVAQQVKRLLVRMRLASKWTSHKSEEVVKYIAVDAPLLWERPPQDQVNVLNGLLAVNTRALSPHSPDFLSPIQLPVRFDAAARCPMWDKFIGEVFPSDSESIAWEIPAWLMTPDTSIQKAILLMGDGANGKSTYLRAVLAFIGKHNVAAVSLHKLENDRFSAARLIGRLANICPDLPGTDLTGTSVFKAITGGDPLMAEYKFKDSFDFVPYARLVFSANHPPKSQDASPAFFRRWIVVPFERTFADKAPDTIPGDKLDAILSDPAELSGVLNKALIALAAIRTRGLSESDSIKRATDEFRRATDPLAVWLDRCTVFDPAAVTPQDQLHRDYCRNCADAGRPTITKTAFGRAMKKLRPGVTDHQRTVSGTLVWCYIGIALVISDTP
jgi:P4 family phage/plasmid primase-like protien